MKQISGQKRVKEFLLSGTTTKTEVAGLSLLVGIFAIVMMPIATSEADPYGIGQPLQDVLNSIDLSYISEGTADSDDNRVIYKIKVRLDQPFDQNQFKIKSVPQIF